MNLSSQRIWCYLCETEVFLPQRRNSIVSNDSSDTSRYSERIYERAMSVGSGGGGESPESSGDEDDGDRRHLDGLVGLQNIANTCYMNAALQALSNSPPLTTYFLDCGDIIEATSELTGNQRKIGLAKSYHRLMKEMWCRNKRSNGELVVVAFLSFLSKSFFLELSRLRRSARDTLRNTERPPHVQRVPAARHAGVPPVLHGSTARRVEGSHTTAA